MSDAWDDDDAELIRAALRGVKAAQKVLLCRLARSLEARAHAFIRVYRVPWHVSDMVGSAWAHLYENGGRRLLEWRADGGSSVEGFCGRIAWHLWASQRRSERTKQRGGGVEHVDITDSGVSSRERTPEGVVLDQDLLQRLWAHLMAKLPPRGLLVLRLVFADGLTPEETARAIGTSGQVVHNWLFRIRTLAREFLDQQ